MTNINPEYLSKLQALCETAANRRTTANIFTFADAARTAIPALIAHIDRLGSQNAKRVKTWRAREKSNIETLKRRDISIDRLRKNIQDRDVTIARLEEQTVENY